MKKAAAFISQMLSLHTTSRSIFSAPSMQVVGLSNQPFNDRQGFTLKAAINEARLSESVTVYAAGPGTNKFVEMDGKVDAVVATPAINWII